MTGYCLLIISPLNRVLSQLSSICFIINVHDFIPHCPSKLFCFQKVNTSHIPLKILQCHEGSVNLKIVQLLKCKCFVSKLPSSQGKKQTMSKDQNTVPCNQLFSSENNMSSGYQHIMSVLWKPCSQESAIDLHPKRHEFSPLFQNVILFQ
jgi:hypothetical protein